MHALIIPTLHNIFFVKRLFVFLFIHTSKSSTFTSPTILKRPCLEFDGGGGGGANEKRGVQSHMIMD
jgi:hypothetical protein